ncbi:MAG: AtpZ/AtpI family protein [Acidimicrobiales bacterium]
MNNIDRRELNNGFGEALSRAFEFAVTPAIFGFLGWLLDRWLGVVPLFTLVFSLTVVSYMMWKLFRLYTSEMEAQERKLPTRREVGR